MTTSNPQLLTGQTDPTFTYSYNLTASGSPSLIDQVSAEAFAEAYAKAYAKAKAQLEGKVFNADLYGSIYGQGNDFDLSDFGTYQLPTDVSTETLDIDYGNTNA